MEDKYNKNQGYQEKIKQRYNKIKCKNGQVNQQALT